MTFPATHYHELTTLADHLDRVENVHVAVDGEPPEAGGTESRSAEQSRSDDVTFLRTVEDGPTDRSYGIHVADLAGVPDPVIERSRDVLGKLRADEAIETKGGSSGGTKQVVFDVGSGELRTEREDTAGRDETAVESDADDLRDRFGEDAEAVLEELADLSVGETAPVELLNRAQEWQERLDGDDESESNEK